jgi:sugar phosphate permease
MAIAAGGLAIALLYPLLVRPAAMAKAAAAAGAPPSLPASPSEPRPRLSALFSSRSLLCAYAGSGLQLYVAGAAAAWLPTYFNRYYGLAVDRAASLAALFLLIAGAGMVLCGMLSDRLARARPDRTIALAILYCLTGSLLLFVALALPAGAAQLAMLGAAIFLAAGTTGPAGAMVANLSPLAIHGTAFATLTLANNMLGLAPGPILTGHLADRIGLLDALRLLPLAGLLAAAAFSLARHSYRKELAIRGEPGAVPA